MNKAEIMNKMTRTINKVGFKFKKHSPEILVVAGVAGAVTSAVMACKATTKLNDILEEAKRNLDVVHHYEENPEELPEEYTKEQLTVAVYTQTGLKVAKLYAPAVVLGALSITAIFTSNNILRKRNVALAAAYATVDKGFKEYRNRVIDRFGKEIDNELKYNVKAKEIEETVVNEDGTEATVKKTVNVVDPNSYSVYARFFDDGCIGWNKDPELNLMFLKQQQAHANDKLKSDGWLLLNDVYDMLGIPRTKAGCVVGWVYDEEHPIGDNFVDFGIMDAHKPACRDFVNGYERTILLDFNVDGNVYQYL